MSHREVLWLFGALWALTTGCQHQTTSTHEVWLSTQSDSVSWMHVRQTCTGRTDSMKLTWPVYRWDTADLTGNGTPEIIVGVEKSTRYWPTSARRLFVYQLVDDYRIRPLWLGSRVAWPLQDFKICHDSVPARIITTELNNDSLLLHAQYRYKGFGLKFEKFFP